MNSAANVDFDKHILVVEKVFIYCVVSIKYEIDMKYLTILLGQGIQGLSQIRMNE